jgi:gamma-glutamylcyclotransferase (GGCT)/AIG2-like uncharacterized protein YtfP/cation transport regulator ChaC
MKKIHLFVYGTLRRHERNHHFLKDAIRVAEQAWTYGELFDTHLGYPMLKASNTKKVYGEVYEISEVQLKEIDILEDYQEGSSENLYERVLQSVFIDTKTIQAYVYLSEKSCNQVIPSGDWKIHHLLKSRPQTFYYFAYGSCMDIERFKLAKVDHLFEKVTGAGVLEGYTMKYLFSTSDGGRADIIEDGGQTEGIVYEAPFAAIDYLFKREGYHIGMYRATFVDVVVGNELLKDVLTFHVYEKTEAELAPPEHYAVEILRGSKNRLSSSYYLQLLQQLENLQVEYNLEVWK